jgi:hypothetical protein
MYIEEEEHTNTHRHDTFECATFCELIKHFGVFFHLLMFSRDLLLLLLATQWTTHIY